MVALKASLLRTTGTQALRAQIHRQSGLVARRPLASTIRAAATENDVGKYHTWYHGEKRSLVQGRREDAILIIDPSDLLFSLFFNTLQILATRILMITAA